MLMENRLALVSTKGQREGIFLEGRTDLVPDWSGGHTNPCMC